MLSEPERAAVIAEARGVLARHARTFRLAGRLLPAARLDDAAVVYAFCRLVDDAVDEAADARHARSALAGLRAELSGASPARPIVAAYAEVAARCGIPAEAAHELFEGMASDLGPVRIPDEAALLRYAYRVAGTVGLMMSGVLGVRDPVARPFAIDLGVAMQLTNIARDVAEDAARDRVYLPADRLAAAGVRTESVLDGSADRDRLGRVVRELLALADRYYRSGQDGLRYIPLAPRPAIAAAGSVYRAIGLEILRHDADVLSGRAVVPGRARLAWLCRAAATAPLRGLFRAPRHDATLHRALAGLPGAVPGGHAP
ncbi:MAG: phytoene/squalene synthase family protein [Deltaproteobacteria bacterium]|nr:phytoene/squalene synthase family protein [Deltaproteobacteria bacterium]MCB9787480.1 phytoene/squalene synthase family protein [Deltaproteobacteria bacterium]